MALFKCEKCGCAENTALSGQGFQRVRLFDWSYAPELKGKMLCSECGPRQFNNGKPTQYAGKWHGQFKKERYMSAITDRMELNKLRDECLINMAQNGARVVIIIAEDKEFLKKKFRTWVKLYPNDLNRIVLAGPNSKFVFVVKNLNELPMIARYQASMVLSVNVVAGKICVLKSKKYMDLVLKTSDNLEIFLNKNAVKELSDDYLFPAHSALVRSPENRSLINVCHNGE
jgi:hypothetical protein